MGHVLLFFVKCDLFFNSYLKPGIKCDFTKPMRIELEVSKAL
jgi:hypothetical protein